MLEPFGPNLAGLMIFDPSGRFPIVITRRGGKPYTPRIP